MQAVVLAGQVLTQATAATTCRRAPGHETRVISTLAGGVGGTARATRVGIFVPCGVSYGTGHVYITNPKLAQFRSVNPQTDWLTTPAGTGSTGPLHGPATAAGVGIPPILGNCGMGARPRQQPGDHRSGQRADAGVIAHRTGNYYGQARPPADVCTVAGTGGLGFSGDGGPATSAQLDYPAGLALDGAGNLVFGDRDNSQLRVVAVSTGTFYGQPMTAGDIYSITSDGSGRLFRGRIRLGAQDHRAWRSTPRATWSSPTPTAPGSGWWPSRRAPSTASR